MCAEGTPLPDDTPCTLPGGGEGACRSGLCAPLDCGNGTLEEGEECDDGNLSNEDGCLASCRQATCRDGYVWAGTEECDDGNDEPGDGCEPDCTWTCESAADCDDGNACDGIDACEDHVCREGAPPGDGAACAQPGGDPGICVAGACVEAGCGNRFVEAGEECDDGNGESGDGCEPDCTWTCENDVDCDDHDACSGEETCSGHVCQDGEDLADGATCTLAGGGAGVCRGGSCASPRCGNGAVEPGEECDDGNTSNEDACLNTCVDATCGDGYIWVGVEQCEGLMTRPCTTSCLTTGTERCDACRWSGVCTPPAETCNGRDDDCNAVCDNGFTCCSGTTQSCTVCGGAGTQTCRPDCSGWGACTRTEECNGCDDDADGACDNGFGCCRGATVTCSNLCGVPGTRVCGSSCAGFGPCCATTEVCGNGCDDDCDGVTNEGCGVPVLGSPCTTEGECTGGGLTCNENWGICVEPDCTGKPDFTPCELVDASDRAYDICVNGTCVSPGCGGTNCNVPGPFWTMPDTNQRACYDNTASIACRGVPGTSDCATTAFCGQDWQYGWDTTHPSADRWSRTGDAQPVVHDLVSGLFWQGCIAGLSGNDCRTGTSMLPNWNDAIAYCEGLTWGGYSDWRLPSLFELHSIVDFGQAGTKFDPVVFPEIHGIYYWTIDTSAMDSNWALSVNSYDGSSGGMTKTTTTSMRARCVRSAPKLDYPMTRFTRTPAPATEPVVQDLVTGLVWQGCAAGLSDNNCRTGSPVRYFWQDALAYCEGLRWNGLDDWRLPDAHEIMTIISTYRWQPAIRTDVFPATPSCAYFRTSTTNPGSMTFAEAGNFCNGGVASNQKSLTTSWGEVRCVRNGP